MIQGADGSSIGADKLAALRDNSNYFRSELEALGLHVYGDYDSPVIPVLLYNPTKVRKRWDRIRGEATACGPYIDIYEDLMVRGSNRGERRRAARMLICEDLGWSRDRIEERDDMRPPVFFL